MICALDQAQKRETSVIDIRHRGLCHYWYSKLPRAHIGWASCLHACSNPAITGWTINNYYRNCNMAKCNIEFTRAAIFFDKMHHSFMVLQRHHSLKIWGICLESSSMSSLFFFQWRMTIPIKEATHFTIPISVKNDVINVSYCSALLLIRVWGQSKAYYMELCPPGLFYGLTNWLRLFSQLYNSCLCCIDFCKKVVLH